MKLNYVRKPEVTCEGCNHLNNAVVIVWTEEDILDLRPDLTPEQRLEALELVGRALTEGSVEYGWEILSSALAIHYPEEEEA